MRRMLRTFLIEARDWIFAVVGIGGVILLPTFEGNWLLAVPVVAVFIVLYVLACFATSRWIEEGRTPESDAR